MLLLFDLFNNINNNVIVNNNEFESRFLSKKLDFFNFGYKRKTIFIETLIKNINKKIIYCNVYVFFSRAKNFIIIFNLELIRINFYRCLKKKSFYLAYYAFNRHEKTIIDYKKNIDE